MRMKQGMYVKIEEYGALSSLPTPQIRCDVYVRMYAILLHYAVQVLRKLMTTLGATKLNRKLDHESNIK